MREEHHPRGLSRRFATFRRKDSRRQPDKGRPQATNVKAARYPAVRYHWAVRDSPSFSATFGR
jgi:hypothetical protein